MKTKPLTLLLALTFLFLFSGSVFGDDFINGLDAYDRKFAMIDRTLANNGRLLNNIEYQQELIRRVKLLHSQGFTFIMASPWESQENIETGNIYRKKLVYDSMYKMPC